MSWREIEGWGGVMRSQTMGMDNATTVDTAAGDISVDALCDGHTVSEMRRQFLAEAIALGADKSTLTKLRDAARISKGPKIRLPAGRYDHCSRGKGWARQGKGSGAVWGEPSDKGGYVVDRPGKWTVGSSDGFARKDQIVYDVRRIDVGNETWTVAS